MMANIFNGMKTLFCLMIRITESLMICIVRHCYRGDNDVMRIISTRKATRIETEFYEKGGM